MKAARYPESRPDALTTPPVGTPAVLANRGSGMTSYTGSEFALQKYVVDLLRFFAKPRVLWFAVPNGEYRSPRTGARLKAQGVRAGVADLVIVGPRGLVHFLELKTKRGTLSEVQRIFADDCIINDCPYSVARSPEDARSTLINWDVIRHEDAAQAALPTRLVA